MLNRVLCMAEQKFSTGSGDQLVWGAEPLPGSTLGGTCDGREIHHTTYLSATSPETGGGTNTNVHARTNLHQEGAALL